MSSGNAFAGLKTTRGRGRPPRSIETIENSLGRVESQLVISREEATQMGQVDTCFARDAPARSLRLLEPREEILADGCPMTQGLSYAIDGVHRKCLRAGEPSHEVGELHLGSAGDVRRTTPAARLL